MARIEDLLQRRTDLSTFLVHLTRADGDTSALENLKSIIKGCKINARTPLGPAAHLEPYLSATSATQKVVCFTETPLEHVWMMLEEIEGRSIRFEPYGLAIAKTTAREAGFNPVWYSDISRRGVEWPATSVNKLVAEAVAKATGSTGKVDEAVLSNHPALKITPFFEQMGPTQGARKEFWWEREWRKIGDYYMSNPGYIVALLAPESEHSELSKFAQDVDARQNWCWACRPILDPRWGLEQMIATLAKVEERHRGPFPIAGR